MVSIANDSVVHGSWGSVDKTALKNKLKDAGDAKATREAYLFVGDMEKTGTWKFPHHVLTDDTLKLHEGGVHSAAQRLVSSGATASDIPKKAATRHLLRHYKALGEEPPESLTSAGKFLCYEEAYRELDMLTVLMNVGPASGYGPDYFIKPKTVDSPEVQLDGIFEEIPGIVAELSSLPVLGVSYKETSLEEILSALESLVDEAEQETAVESVKELVSRKGVGELQEDLVTLNMKTQLAFTNLGKRSKKDYYPSKDELAIINQGYSNTELAPADVLVFTLRSADTEADRQNERFSEDALADMARLSLDKAFLIDHKWETTSQVGKIFAATAQDGALYQKIYVLNDPMNDPIIKNVLAGIYNKVSVGFASNLKDMLCDSCADGKSIYDSSCPHMPGGTDSQGNKTTVTIKGVNDYYEVSLVPIPAQRDAGIRRRSVTLTPEMVKAFEGIRPESIDPNLILPDLAEVAECIRADGEVLVQEQIKNVDTINSDVNGDHTVPETTTLDSEKTADIYVAETVEAEPAVAANLESPAEEVGAAAAANPETEGNGMEDVPAEPAAPAATPPVYDKSGKKTLKELKKLRKDLTKSVEKLEAAVEKLGVTHTQDTATAEQTKALEAKLEALTKFVEAATASTIEYVDRGITAKKHSEQPARSTDSNQWATDIAKSILGGK